MSEATVDSIKINATASTAQAEKGLDRLIVKVEKLSKVINASFSFNETSKLDDFIRSFEKLKHIGEIKISKKLADSVVNLGYAADCLKGVDFSKVEELANAYKKLADVGNIKAPRITGVGKDNGIAAETETVVSKYDEMIQKNSEIQAMYDRVDASGSKYSATIRKLTTQLESGKISEAAWLEELKKINTELDSASPKVEIASKSFDKYGKSAANVVGALDKVGRSVLKTTANIGLMPFKKVGKDILSTTRRLNNFLSSIKRVALYRAIRTVLKEIAQAFQEGTQNLYQYSKAINGEFAKSMDLLATDALYVKNSLGAMSAPIVNNLAPAIDMLTDKFVALLNVVNETVASLTGADTWTRAVKYPVEYAEAADDANKAAKKWKATILGFDEINPLNDNSSNGRGSASDALDYSKMFTEETVTTETAKWAQAVIDAWENADFTGIGTAIGEGIKTGLDNIPWDDINAKGSQFSRSLGTLINGFVEVDGLGRSFGSTIANAINFGVGTLHEFITSVHWESVGTFLGDGINGFFEDWDANDLAETISDGILGAIMLIDGFLTETDFEQVGKKIGEFIKGLKWKEILGGLGTIVAEAIKAAFETFVGMAGEDPFGAALIGSAVVLKIVSIFKGTTTIGLLKDAIAGGLSGAIAKAAEGEAVKKSIEGIAVEGSTVTTAFTGVGATLGAAIGAAVIGSLVGYLLYKGNWFGLGDIADTIMDNGLGEAIDLLIGRKDAEVNLPDKQKQMHGVETAVKEHTQDTFWDDFFAGKAFEMEVEAEVSVAPKRKVAGDMYYAELIKKAGKYAYNPLPINIEIDTDSTSVNNLEKYEKILEYIDEKHTADVNARVYGASNIEYFSYRLGTIPGLTESRIVAVVENAEKITILRTSLDSVATTVISTAIAATENVGLLDIFKGKLDVLEDKDVTATADTKNTSFLDTFKEKLVALADKTVTATAVTKDVSLFDTFKSKLSALADKTVKATANVFGASDVDTLAKKVDALTSKSIDITANVTTVTSTKSDTTSGKAVGTNPNMQYVYLMASGGMPDTGDLFIARENGAELVGQIGNRTSVANNEQIISGISAGVETANAEQNQILREQNELLRQLIAKEGKTVISTASLVSAFGKMNKREGQAMVSLG